MLLLPAKWVCIPVMSGMPPFVSANGRRAGGQPDQKLRTDAGVVHVGRVPRRAPTEHVRQGNEDGLYTRVPKKRTRTKHRIPVVSQHAG